MLKIYYVSKSAYKNFEADVSFVKFYDKSFTLLSRKRMATSRSELFICNSLLPVETERSRVAVYKSRLV